MTYLVFAANLLLVGFIAACMFGAAWHLITQFERRYRRR